MQIVTAKKLETQEETISGVSAKQCAKQLELEENNDDDDDDFPEYPEAVLPELRNKNKYRRCSIDLKCFVGIQPKLLEKIPWDIDGTQIITINCTKNQWVDRSKDGQWWKINTSTRKGLNGVWRIGHCKGSIICENQQCSKLLSEGVVNTNEFSQEGGLFICNCCGSLVAHQWCGCICLTENDRITHKLTYYHQGNHNCNVKPNIKGKVDYIRNLPINPESRKTPDEVKEDIIMYYLANDDINKAVELTRSIDDDSAFQKLKYAAKMPNLKSKPRDDVEAFRRIGQLKSRTDQNRHQFDL